MNGASSEDAVPIGGQYGFVAIYMLLCFLWYIGRTSPRWFSGSLLTGLLPCTTGCPSLYNSWFGLNGYYQPNKLSGAYHVKYLPLYSRALTRPDWLWFQDRDNCQCGGHCLLCASTPEGKSKSLTIVFFLLLGFILSNIVRIFVIDCSSGVRPSTTYGTTIPPIQVLTETC